METLCFQLPSSVKCFLRLRWFCKQRSGSNKLKCEEFGADILKYCVKVGGALTGEHGVGIEKRELMCEAFNNTDIQQQLKIKVALDPNSLLNPGKVYPILRKCAEEGRVHVHGGKTKFPDIPRF